MQERYQTLLKSNSDQELQISQLNHIITGLVLKLKILETT